VPDVVSALASLKVCIVDANSDMRQMIHDALMGMGISQIRECADSNMAQQLIGEFDPDLCIYDWATGPSDALTFVKGVRASESDRQSEMRLIMITGNADTRRVIEARNAGVDEFLVKPISLRALHSRLLTLVDNPRTFVRSPAYNGPDRRRQSRPFAGPDRRDGEGNVDAEAAAGSESRPVATEASR
jgi:two-component system chemotaxis response regulator CheY